MSMALEDVELDEEIETLRDENHRLEAAIEDALEARDKWHSIAHQQKRENERLQALIEEFAAFCADSGWHHVAEELRARAVDTTRDTSSDACVQGEPETSTPAADAAEVEWAGEYKSRLKT